MPTNSDVDELRQKAEDIAYWMFESSGRSQYVRAGRKLLHPDEATEVIVKVIIEAQLALLDRLEKHREDLFWWTGGEYDKTTGIDMRAIQQERNTILKDKTGAAETIEPKAEVQK